MSAFTLPSRVTRSFLLALLALLVGFAPSNDAPRASAAGPYLYVTNYSSNHLILSNLDGTSPIDKGTLSGTLSTPTGIALDTKHHKMYIANYGSNTVVVANLDGSNPSTVTFNPPSVTLDGPAGIALDTARGRMYIVNYLGNNIVRANWDGSEATTLDLGNTLNHPYGIALDTYNYFTVYVTSSGDNKVVRADLNGMNSSVLTFSPSVTLTAPRGIALDLDAGKLYITNALSPSHLIQANLDGTSATDLGNPGNLVSFGLGIAVDHLNQMLYLVSQGNGKIVQTDLNGGNALVLATLTASLSAPAFIAFDTPPDLSVTIINNAAGGIPVGGGFYWNAIIQNNGPNPAIFESGRVIFQDYLPVGPTYTLSGPGGYQVTNTGTISCSIWGSSLTCSESGGTASFAAGAGRMGVSINVIPHDVGTLTNPSGGVCQADPNNVTGDTNLANNTCSSTVTVNPASLLRGRKMYVINSNDSISRANLDGSGATNLGDPGVLATYMSWIALDTVHDKLYIVNYSPAHIIQSNLDGTGGTELGTLGGLLTAPAGIGLDVANNRMYLADAGLTDRIVRADLSGAGGTVLVDLPGSISGPADIALDLVRKRLYVVGYSSDNIYRLNLDGSGGQDLGNLGGLLNDPLRIAVDAVNGKIYVTSRYNNKLLVADLDGKGVTDLGNLGGLCLRPWSVALDVAGGQVYVVCVPAANPLVRINLNGSSPTGLGNLNGLADSPRGIALDLRAYVNLPLIVR